MKRIVIRPKQMKKQELATLAVSLAAAAAFPASVVHNVQDYRALQGDRVVLFHARACRACRVALPRFERLAEGDLRDSFRFATLNVDGDEGLLYTARDMGIRVLPYITLIAEGGGITMMPCSSRQSFEEVERTLREKKRCV